MSIPISQMSMLKIGTIKLLTSYCWSNANPNLSGSRKRASHATLQGNSNSKLLPLWELPSPPTSKPAAALPLLPPHFLWPEAKGSLLPLQLIDPLPEPALGAMCARPSSLLPPRPAHQPLVTSGMYLKLPLTTTAK